MLSMLMVACAAHTTPVSFVPVEPGPRPDSEVESVVFKPMGSACMDAIMAYYADARCTKVSRDGEPDAGMGSLLLCSEMMNQHSDSAYFASRVYLIRVQEYSAPIPQNFYATCVDPWFAVWTYVDPNDDEGK